MKNKIYLFALAFLFFFIPKLTAQVDCRGVSVPLPNVAFVDPNTIAAPCGSTANVSIFVYINPPPSGAIVSYGFDGPTSLSLPSGWSYVTEYGRGTVKVDGLNYVKREVILKPDPYTSGPATIRAAYLCQASTNNWLYSTPKSFILTRLAPVPGLSVNSGIDGSGLMCGSSGTLSASAPNAGSYTWEATGGARVEGQLTYTGGGAVTVTASSNGTVKVRANYPACSNSSGYSNTLSIYREAASWSNLQNNNPIINLSCTSGPGGTYNAGSGIPVSGYSSSCQLTLFANRAQSYSWLLQNTSPAQVSLAASTTTGPTNTLIFSGTPATSGGFTIEVRASNCVGYALPDRVRFIFYIMGGSGAMAYPNPAINELNVQFPATTLHSKKSAPTRVSLYNNQMQEVRNNEVAPDLKTDPACSCATLKIDTKGLSKGKYYLHIRYADNKVEKRQIALE